MKAGWNSLDNRNYIESIEEYKQTVIKSANVFKEPAPLPKEQDPKFDVLGND